MSQKKFYSLKDLSSAPTWDYSLPTITSSNRITRLQWKNSKSFFEDFTKKAEFLRFISLENLALFGGSLISYLYKKPYADFDFTFIPSENTPESNYESEMQKRIILLVDEIKSYMIKKNKETQENKLLTKKSKSKSSKCFSLDEIFVYRRGSCYTIKVPCSPVPIQVSFQKSIEDLFEGIDIDCTSIAYYNNKIIMDEKGKFAVENKLFYFHEKTIKRPSRIIKYFGKDFDIVCPNLDLTKIPTRNFSFGLKEVIDLKEINIFIKEVLGNKIIGKRIELVETQNKNENDDDFSDKDNELSIMKAINKNVKNIIFGKNENLIAIGKGENYKGALKNSYVTDRQIENFYDSKKQILLTEEDELKEINLKILNKFFMLKGKKQTYKEVFVDYFENVEDGDDNDKEQFKYIEKKIEVLTSWHKEKVKKLANTANGCSYFNMNDKKTIGKNIKEYLGKYYKN